MLKKTKKGYTPRVSIFSSRRDTVNSVYIQDAKVIAEKVVEAGFGINNGASLSGLMGVVAKSAFEKNGDVFGVALSNYEQNPHQYLTDFEAYQFHYERQRRLIELGGIYIALPGAVGTFHEILEIHILNILKEINKPLILVGSYFERYKNLIDSFVSEDLMHIDDTKIYYAKDGDEAAQIAVEYLTKLVDEDYYPPIFYPALAPNDIYNHIRQNTNQYRILFENTVVTVFPEVYPSNRFRSSKIFAKLVRSLSKDKVVLDVACGHGAMGIVALDAGAKEVVMLDINKIAVENVAYNLAQSPNANRGKVIASNLFEKLPDIYKKHFDIIFFNPPFHNEDVDVIDSSLAHAFKTEKNQGSVLVRFLQSAKEYLTNEGLIYIGFSNKDTDALALLEKSFQDFGYTSTIVDLENADTIADNRVYKVTVSK